MDKHCRAWKATDDSTIQRIRFTCWISNAADAHSEYVILIIFPQQQWLQECASMLRYTQYALLI